MNKIMKKVLSVFLCIALILCIAPVKVFASDTDPYLDGETYYRISNGQYIAFDTNYEKMISYFQSQLSQRNTEVSYYFATKDPQYAYTYSSESDKEATDQVSARLFDDIMQDVFTMNYTNPENASLGDYLYHSITSYSQGSGVYSSRYDDPAPGNDRYYTFYIYLTDVKYYTDYNREMLIENAAKEFSDNYISPNDSDYDKVKTIYDFVVRNTVYDYDVYKGEYSLEDERYNTAHSAFGALYGALDNTADYDLTCFKTPGGESIIKNANQGKSVCQGYSKLFYYLCIMNGINCRIVDGDYTENSGKKSDPHEWNYVYLDDDGDGVREWFQVDTTFASQKSIDAANINNYDYFLCGSENPVFSEENHQQPYSKDSSINQLYDWYADENKSSLHDYNIIKKDISNYTYADIVAKRTGVNSAGNEVLTYCIVDSNNKLHSIYINSSNQIIGTEALEGFDYDGKTDVFDFCIPYLVPV
ncbi:MAG: transglutaminase domain-containing protein, partial [Eubacterium sp.]